MEPEQISVYINFSSLDLIQQCMKKAYFRLHRSLAAEIEHPALTTGKGVHKALEVWYAGKREDRKASSWQTDQNISRLLAGQEPDLTGKDLRVAAIAAYLNETDSLKNNPNLEARDRSNVINILNAYFDYYLEDEFELFSDKDGPFLERSFELPVPLSRNYYEAPFEKKPLRIYLHGTIDMILQNALTGSLVVTDHKTSSSLGKDFINRIKPNFQYTGYFWGAMEYFELQPEYFMVNGLQIAKTKQSFLRQRTHISLDEIEDLWLSLEDASRRYLDATFAERWPMSAPNACTMWGGCEYKQVCEVGPKLRENVLAASFTEVAKNETNGV